MKTIPLTKGYSATVDDCDFELLNQWKWQVVCTDTKRYAGRNPGGGGRSKYVSMHRLLLNAPKGMEVDHLDGDGLNNRRSNLRLCTHAENLCNVGPPRNNTSGIKGVSWYKRVRKWRVRITHLGKDIFAGYFSDRDDAARAVKDLIISLRGDAPRRELEEFKS